VGVLTMSASKPCWVLLSALGLVLWPVIVTAYGDWWVGQVQEQLQKAGLNPGPIDGMLGPRTKAALRRYQASQGLPPTGVLDEATRQALLPSGHDPGIGERPQEPWLQAPPGGIFGSSARSSPCPSFSPALGCCTSSPTPSPSGRFWPMTARATS
jgi:peptidoglycan hydrolase-like protein with peptidoglycan-binding domain